MEPGGPEDPMEGKGIACCTIPAPMDDVTG
jgi:hypothetical protein